MSMRLLAPGFALAVMLSVAASPSRAEDIPQRSAVELMDALMWNREPVGGPFALTDHTGKRRTDADFRGKFMLVYFGFTYCPDICPTDLQEIGLAIDKLGAAGEAVQPLFITVDPERDTPEHLAEYVALFHPRLVALTGEAKAISQVALAYKAYYTKVPSAGGDYTVDHSVFVYLMDREGKYLGFFPPGTSADRMVEVIRPHLAAVHSQ